MARILLVEPEFPIPRKSRNHKSFLPIGLLKIAAYLRDRGHEVKLVRATPQMLDSLPQAGTFDPDEVWVTSLFTYWAKYVRDAVQQCRALFPNAHIRVGGIYASLLPADDVRRYTGCDEVHQGVIPEVEEHARTHPAAYDLVNGAHAHGVRFQILHASRGCPRECGFCGTWRIEPEFTPESSVKERIHFPGVVFYDNNFLMNPYVEGILGELIELRRQGKLRWVESESGLDGRILVDRPHLASMLREAGFRYPRIAWDWGYDQKRHIEEQIRILTRAGYKSRDIFVFMLYNYHIPFEEMERKRIKCWEWQVQIADCRFRPLDQLSDDYRPQVIGQTSADYYICEGWDDALVKQFRRNVRRQNICVRMGYQVYSSAAEHKRLDKAELRQMLQRDSVEDRRAYLEALGADSWTPGQISYPEGYTPRS